MTLDTKRFIIGGLGLLFLFSLVLVQWTETVRRAEEAGLRGGTVEPPASSRACVDCHSQMNPGIVDHWRGSTHAATGVGCVECHQSAVGEPDSFTHHGALIATVVTPRDCGHCHPSEAEEFAESHHAAGGNILASLDNFLAETVEGSRVPFDPHTPTPGRAAAPVNGLASAFSGCQQCHGSKVGLQSTDGGVITVDDLRPDDQGMPTNAAAMASIAREGGGRPALHPGTWPNTGIGRLNLDGSRGSCSACHSRHDFSPRRARQPENCGKCHLGPEHPGLGVEVHRVPTQVDEEIEWTWFYLWHHEGRRARHGAAMMAPDYTHWHGMYEVAERFYMELIPQAQEIVEHAVQAGRRQAAAAAGGVLDGILSRPEHAWFTEGAESESARIRAEMTRRYGEAGR